MELLNPFLVDRLKENKIESLFPVQVRAIPYVVAAFRSGLANDVCICSPTGSGKTLAYGLPIIHCLLGKAVRSVGCVVIVPTRELAAQVSAVFTEYTRGTTLSIAVVTGQTSIAEEKKSLVKTYQSADGTKKLSSKVDIIIATPGRLIDHIHATEGFHLKQCRFLVVDEADMLLSESYQEWAAHVMGALPQQHTLPSYQQRWPGDDSTALPLRGSMGASSVHKVLCSATLTHQIAKLSEIRLVRPKFFILGDTHSPDQLEVGKPFALPTALEEFALTVEQSAKPLYLLYILFMLMPEIFRETIDGINEAVLPVTFEKGVGSQNCILIFVNSVDNTHKLCRLLELYGLSGVREFSGLLPHIRRGEVVDLIRTGAVKVIVSSDAMGRGMDFEAMYAVINYDPPVNTPAYVHRVGRTARAGSKGTAITLLTDGEKDTFKDIRDKAYSVKEVTKLRAKKSVITKLMSTFEDYRKLLKYVERREKSGYIQRDMPLQIQKEGGGLDLVEEGDIDGVEDVKAGVAASPMEVDTGDEDVLQYLDDDD